MLRVLLWLVAIGLVALAVLLAKGRWVANRSRPRGAIAASVLLFVPPRVLPVPGELPEHRRQRLVGALRGLAARGLLAGRGALLVRSPWGRLLRGIREDEDAIRSLGKNVFAIKMQALVIGGLFGALGGMLYVLPSSVQPDSMGRALTFFCYTALLSAGGHDLRARSWARSSSTRPGS